MRFQDFDGSGECRVRIRDWHMPILECARYQVCRTLRVHMPGAELDTTEACLF